MINEIPDKPSDIVSKGINDASVDKQVELPPNKDNFRSLMKQDTDVASKKSGKSDLSSPMNIYSRNKAAQTVNTKQVLQTMKDTSGKLENIKSKLNTKNLSLTLSQRDIVSKRLANAKSYLHGATKSYSAPSKLPNNSNNPITKFLNMVSDGQRQLNEAAEKVNNLNSSGESVNAAELLKVQVKLQKAQQEIEYTSVLLGKAVDAIKQMFNIQL